jgi:hypothetical protein
MRLRTVGIAGALIAVTLGTTLLRCRPPTACVPGQSIACVGPGGCSSGQACKSDGSGYEACSCTSGTGGGGPGGGSGDSGIPDAGVDAGCDDTSGACDTCPVTCHFGEFCVLDAGSATCIVDAGNYCGTPNCGPVGYRCSGGPPERFCLRDSAYVSYCGADCSAGQACPLGFRCQDVLSPNYLYGTSCVTSADCIQAVCPDGGCACVDGTCGCAKDSDCPSNGCSMGMCGATGARCVSDQDCPAIQCVASDGGGGLCRMGQNCTLARGLTCSQAM